MRVEGDKIIISEDDLRNPPAIPEVEVKPKTAVEALGLTGGSSWLTAATSREPRGITYSCARSTLSEAVGDLEVVIDDLRDLGFADLADRAREAFGIANFVYESLVARNEREIRDKGEK